MKLVEVDFMFSKALTERVEERDRGGFQLLASQLFELAVDQGLDPRREGWRRTFAWRDDLVLVRPRRIGGRLTILHDLAQREAWQAEGRAIPIDPRCVEGF